MIHHLFFIIMFLFVNRSCADVDTHYSESDKQTLMQGVAHFFTTDCGIEIIDDIDYDFLSYELTQVNASPERLYKVLKKIITQSGSHYEYVTRMAKFINKQCEKTICDIEQCVKTLVSDQKKCFSKCLEIGTPGICCAAFKKKELVDCFTLVHSPKMTDYIHSMFIHSLTDVISSCQGLYNLHAYDPLDDSLEANSFDLVIMPQGLRYCSPEKIETFMVSVAHVLRPGGVLVFCEYDCQEDAVSERLLLITELVRSIVIGMDQQEAIMQVKQFKPYVYWNDTLTKCGFGVLDSAACKEPAFVKSITLYKKQEDVSHRIPQTVERVMRHQEYQRDAVKTYLTTPQWYRKDLLRAAGSSTPGYAFPYFESIASYWNIFGNSYKTAIKKEGYSKALIAGDTVANIVAGLGLTLEFAAKGLCTIPLRMWYDDEDDATIRLTVIGEHDYVTSLDKRIKLVEKVRDAMHVIEIPRHKDFVYLVKKMLYSGILIHEIAGNKVIQARVRTCSEKPFSVELPEGCQQEYDWQLPGESGYWYMAITVPVKVLNEFFAALNQQSIELVHLHDF